MVDNIIDGVQPPHRRARLDGARDEGAGQGEARRRCTWASAIPTSGATTRRCEIVARRRLRQRRARRAVRVPPPARQARQAGRPHRVVDDAADGERGEPAAAERAQLPGRHPAAAVLRPERRRRRRTTARIGAVIGHEISHSFDDKGAAVRRRGQAAPTGGRRRTWSTSRRRARRWRRSTTPTSRCPDLRVNGKLTLGENIADLAGLAAAYDAYQLSLSGKPRQLTASPAISDFFLLRPELARQVARGVVRLQVTTDGHSPAPTAPPPCATSTPGTRRSTSSRRRRCIWPPEKRVRVW